MHVVYIPLLDVAVTTGWYVFLKNIRYCCLTFPFLGCRVLIFSVGRIIWNEGVHHVDHISSICARNFKGDLI